MSFVIALVVAVLLYFLANGAFMAVLYIGACTYFIAWAIDQLRTLSR